MTNLSNRIVLSKSKGKKNLQTSLNSFQKQFSERLLITNCFTRKGQPEDFSNSGSTVMNLNYLLEVLFEHINHFDNGEIDAKWYPAIDLIVCLQSYVNEVRKNKDVSLFVKHFQEIEACKDAYITITQLASGLVLDAKDGIRLMAATADILDIFYHGISIEENL
jgi:hypothetical protein